ncbi:MAG TPA: hypothetical protein VFC56_10300 [Stellaceae bacterium]|nr:hypothetical protein [Stellaceae bacterium]
MSIDSIAAQRARLSELESALVNLRAQYDLLMNGFKFDEARVLVPRIAAAEREVAWLVESLPPLSAAPPAPYTVARPRRR